MKQREEPNLNMNVVFLSSAPICRCHHPGYPSTAAPRSSGNSCTSNALTPHKANKPGTKRRRGRRKRALLPIPGWEPPAQCPSTTACHTPPQPPAPTIHPAHIFTNFLSPSTHPHTHRGDPWGLWALVFLGLTCGRGGSLAAAAAPPVSSFSCTLLESVCHLAAGPGGFLSPTTTIASVTSAGGKEEGGARGGAKGTVPGTAQKMSKRQAFASAVPAAGGGD